MTRASLRWPPPPPPIGSESSKWVLVADDDDILRELWVEVLTGAGYRTVEARTGEAVIELMRAIVPDLLILDLHMPHGSGVDVLHELRGSAALQAIPVLIVSGFLDDMEPLDGGGLNIVGSLPKPLRMTDFLTTVQSALRAPRADATAGRTDGKGASAILESVGLSAGRP
jgi:two-component system cell cycle response regulator DivK